MAERRVTNTATLEVLVQPKVQPANSHFPAAFPVRIKTSWERFLKLYKTRKHNSVIEQCTVDFKLSYFYVSMTEKR